MSYAYGKPAPQPDRMFCQKDIKYPSGFLTKQGGFYKNWKKRFFVVKHNVIQYYKSEFDQVSCGFFMLDDVEVVVKDSKTFTFMIRPVGKLKRVKAYKLGNDGLVGLSNHKSFKLKASSYEEMCIWVDELKKRVEYTAKK